MTSLPTPFANHPNHTPLLLQAFQPTPLSRPPVWMMRQAGRYMHEYQTVRQTHSFMDICKRPEVTVEVTLQPLKAFGFDASIIFSDILIPLEAMGLELHFGDKTGPQFPNPLRHKDDLKRLQVMEPRETCWFLPESLKLMRKELQGTGITLIGFAGAPWTLASYAIEGHSWKTGQHTKRFLYDEPEAFHQLMHTISTQLIDYLCMQVEAGAEVLQLFDTWGGVCPTPYYASCVDAYQRMVIEGVKAKYPHIPIILFVKHSRGLYHYLASSPADCISIDDLTPLDTARGLLPNKVLQGNLDSSCLFMQNQTALVERVHEVLRAGGETQFIFNLGHGILPQTPRENVALVVDTIKQWKAGS